MKNVLKRMGIVATLVGSSYVSGLEAYAQDKPVEAPKPGQKYSVPNDSKVEEEYLFPPPGDFDKPVKNSLEKKVDKNEPKKERFPYVFIPGKTKDLDEIRFYSNEITQSTKAEREKLLNEIKGKKGVSYNFDKGYMLLTPKSDIPGFYEAVKESAIFNMVLEDGSLSSEEKKFIQKHTPNTKSLYRGFEDNSKKASPKEESLEKPKSNSLVDFLFESWKAARIKQIEREYNENPVDITEGILKAGRIYFENQGKVPKNQSNKK